MFTLEHVFQSDKLEGAKKLAAIQIGGKFNNTSYEIKSDSSIHDSRCVRGI